MKGEEKLWAILNEKLDNLRATNRLPQAIRVAETALDVARRAFKENQTALATSFEKLGQLLEQKGDHAGAEAYLLKAHAILEKGNPPDHRAIYRSARRLALLFDSLGQSEEAIDFYQKAIAAGTEVEDVPYSDIGTMLNNVALILRKSGRQKAAEPCYLRGGVLHQRTPIHRSREITCSGVGNQREPTTTSDRRHCSVEMQSGGGLPFAR